MNSKNIFLIVSAVLLFATGTLMGQSNGTIQGAVTDPSGAVVPGATVIATNTNTGVETMRVTNSAGLYVISVPPGNYNLKVTSVGFQTVNQQSIAVEALSTLGMNVELKVGATTDSVTVDATAQMVQTEGVTLGQTMQNEVYKALPLSMGGGVPRDATQFIALAPGVSSVVTQSAGSSFTSFNGAQQDTNGLYLEGVAMTYPNWQGDTRLIALGISVEAVDQFQVEVNGQKAQYQGQGFHNYQIKSGTNQIHGTAFEYLRNTKMDARGFFSPFLFDREDKQNEFGGNVGGKIIKDKLFYFANASAYTFRTSSAPNYQTIPTTGFRRGDFSALLPTAPIYDPTTLVCNGAICTKTQFPGNIIPTNRFSSASQVLQSYLPSPTNGDFTNNYLVSLPRRINNANGTAKVDWNFSDKDRVYVTFVRGTWETDYSGNASFTSTLLPLPYTSSPGVVVEVTTIGQFHYTRTFSPAIINSLSVAASRLWIPIYSNTIDGNYPKKAGLTGLPTRGLAASGFPSVTFTGTNSPKSWGGTPFDEAQNNYTLTDNVSWLHGKHVFGFGYTYQWVQDARPNIHTDGTTASFTFNSTATAGFNPTGTLITTTGNAYASYILGAVTNATVTDSNLVGAGHRFGNYSLHFQDDWKVLSKLTLNLGLRWDVYKPYSEQYNRFSFLDPNLTSPSLGGAKGALQYAGFGANTCNCKTPLNTHYLNFQPRLGLAYSWNSKTVIRGGFGISDTLGTGGIGGRGATGPGVTGFNQNGAIASNVTGAPLFNWDQGVPPRPLVALQVPEFGQGNTVSNPTSAVSVTYVDPELSGKAPYYINWNFGIQREVFKNLTIGVDYSASVGHFLGGAAAPAYFTNQMPKKYLALGSLLAAQATAANVAAAKAVFPEIALPFSTYSGTISNMLKPFPQYGTGTGGVSCFSCSLGNSHYNSLQVTLNRRFSSGFFAQFAYTFSKIIDNVPSGGQLGSAGGTRDPFNTQLDKGLGQTDRTHILRGSFVYNLPFGSGRALRPRFAVLRAAVSGWQLTGTWTMNTGAPLGASGTCTLTGISSTCIPSYNRAFTGPVRINGDYGTGNTLAPGAVSYIDRNAFVNPAPYTFGDMPRSAPYGLRNPFYWNLDSSIRREFPIHENLKFMLGMDVFNVMNTVIFSAPSLALDSANFGQITSAQNEPRKIQLNARITF